MGDRHLRELCNHAAARGIVLHLQNHPTRFFPSSGELTRFVASLGKANARYALNVGHLPVVESPYTAKVRALARKLARKVVVLDAVFPDQDAEFAEGLAPLGAR